MREMMLIGAAILAAIAAFVMIRRRAGDDCLP
jgi:hypothetical protein